ncbi:MAG TPA: hypothetical protein VG992_04275 [Candidatus Saccharimonadales bacterium]|nr:hypothetical protein [Candidatus Saccharimonadales bacterium]
MNSRYQICVSGAAKGDSVEEGKALAMALGAAIAAAGHTLMTGATIGLPNYAAEAYKAAGGVMSVGISPASSKVEHIRKYRLPVLAYDTILYTGLHYVGRDTLLITSSDAVVSIGGRLGTLHEFTIAMETDTPIGFLQGAGGVSAEIQNLMSLAHPLRPKSVVAFNESPTELIQELTLQLDREHAKYHNLYQ